MSSARGPRSISAPRPASHALANEDHHRSSPASGRSVVSCIRSTASVATVAGGPPPRASQILSSGGSPTMVLTRASLRTSEGRTIVISPSDLDRRERAGQPRRPAGADLGAEGPPLGATLFGADVPRAVAPHGFNGEELGLVGQRVMPIHRHHVGDDAEAELPAGPSLGRSESGLEPEGHQDAYGRYLLHRRQALGDGHGGRTSPRIMTRIGSAKAADAKAAPSVALAIERGAGRGRSRVEEPAAVRRFLEHDPVPVAVRRVEIEAEERHLRREDALERRQQPLVELGRSRPIRLSRHQRGRRQVHQRARVASEQRRPEHHHQVGAGGRRGLVADVSERGGGGPRGDPDDVVVVGVRRGVGPGPELPQRRASRHDRKVAEAQLADGLGVQADQVGVDESGIRLDGHHRVVDQLARPRAAASPGPGRGGTARPAGRDRGTAPAAPAAAARRGPRSSTGRDRRRTAAPRSGRWPPRSSCSRPRGRRVPMAARPARSAAPDRARTGRRRRRRRRAGSAGDPAHRRCGVSRWADRGSRSW